MADDRSGPVRSASVRVNLLGKRELIGASGAPVAMTSRRAWALLALLLSTPDRPWARDALATMLWPRSDEDHARASLRQELSTLRRALAEAGWEPMVATGETVTLSPEGADIDVRRLVHAGTDPEARLDALRAYRGELLTGLSVPSPAFETWLETERRELRSRAIHTGLSLAEGASPEIAEEAARRVLKIEPASETAFAILAHCLAARGEKTEALRTFQALEAALRDDLDAEPSADTQALVAALREPGEVSLPRLLRTPEEASERDDPAHGSLADPRSADPAPAVARSAAAPTARQADPNEKAGASEGHRRPRRRWIAATAAALTLALCAPLAWGGVRYAQDGVLRADNPLCALPMMRPDDEPFQLGVVVPMDREFGQRQAWGVQRYLRDHARDLPFKVELVLRDSEGEVERLAAILDEFEREGVDAVIGPMQSRLAWDAKQWGTREKVPVLSPLASAAYLARPGERDYFFRLGMSDTVRARSLVTWLKARNLHNDPYILHEWRQPGTGEPEIYGASQAQAVKALLGGPARTLRFERGNEESQLRAVQEVGNDGRAVLIFGYTSNIEFIVSQMQERGLENEIFLMGVVMTRLENADFPDPSKLHVVSNVNSEARNFEDSARLRRIFEEENPDLEYDLSAWYAYDATAITLDAARLARGEICGERDHGPTLASHLRATPTKRRTTIHGGFLADTQEVFFASDGFEIVDGRFRPVGIGGR